MDPIVQLRRLGKTYAGGFEALRRIDLEIRRGEVFALLGPNGAGKTTLIHAICGIVHPSTGRVFVDGLDVVRDARRARRLIGLVPQELALSLFETVWSTVSFSRGLFGLRPDPAYIEQLLKDLSLWDKKDSRLIALSGGMKRRVLIAKALSHQPRILFLDEPTAGVDVELRHDMWRMVRRLRDDGMTIVLTTHYIEEAQEMADRVAVIRQGRVVLVEETGALMRKLGTKELRLQLPAPLDALPEALAPFPLQLAAGNSQLVYRYDGAGDRIALTALLRKLGELGIEFSDLHTHQSSLEDIFLGLVKEPA